MEDFQYKEYTEEENKIYYAAMDKIMEGLQNGLSFHDACGVVDVEDGELKKLIEDDALKIMIADMSYVKGFTLEQVAETLKLQIDTISKANAEMLEDVSITSAEVFKLNNPGTQFGNV